MPIYNVAPYVERALLSALNQTFESIEFLLVDDRGTDNSMEIVHRIIKEHPRGKDIRIIEHPHNIGTGGTKNTAIDNAQGEYLFFMDSDDEIIPECIHILYNKMIENSVDLVVGSYVFCDKNKNIVVSSLLPNIKIIGELSLAKYYYLDTKPFYVQTWNKMYNISFLRNNKIYCIPSHLCEDLIFTFLVSIHSTSCLLINDITYYSYLRRNSTTDQERNNFLSISTANQYKEILYFKKKLIIDNSIEYIYSLHYYREAIRISELCVRSNMSFSLKKKYIDSFCDFGFFEKCYSLDNTLYLKYLIRILNFSGKSSIWKVVVMYLWTYFRKLYFVCLNKKTFTSYCNSFDY